MLYLHNVSLTHWCQTNVMDILLSIYPSKAAKSCFRSLSKAAPKHILWRIKCRRRPTLSSGRQTQSLNGVGHTTQHRSIHTCLSASRNRVKYVHCRPVHKICEGWTKRQLCALIPCTLGEKNNDQLRGTQRCIALCDGEDRRCSVYVFMSSYWLLELKLSQQLDWIALLWEVLCLRVFLCVLFLHQGREPLLRKR